MKTMIMNVRREGYAPNQIERSLTVRELIDILEGYDPDSEIITSHDSGYTYGSVKEYGFDIIECD